MLRTKQRLVIVGGGHAGGRLAHHLVSLGYRGSVTLVGEESHEPYERPALSKEILLGTKSPEDLTLKSPAGEHNADTVRLRGVAVRAVDPQAGVLHLNDGTTIEFDQVVIATGGKARRPSLVGANQPSVVSLRTLDDALALAAYLQNIRRLVIVGGGVIGLEVASSARQRGVHVTLIEASAHLMGRIGPPILSQWLQHLHEKAGVEILTRTTVKEFRGSDRDVELEAVASDGSIVQLSCDLVLVAIGQDPSSDILGAERIGSNGLLVDQWCRVPDLPNCYAIGDVANTFNPIYGRHIRQETWRNAENQARALAEMFVDRKAPYVEVPWMWTDQHGINIQVVGVWTPGASIIERGRFGSSGSSCFFMEDGRITGGVLIDLGRERRPLEQLVTTQMKIDAAHLSDPGIPLRTLMQKAELNA